MICLFSEVEPRDSRDIERYAQKKILPKFAHFIRFIKFEFKQSYVSIIERYIIAGILEYSVLTIRIGRCEKGEHDTIFLHAVESRARTRLEIERIERLRWNRKVR